MTELDTLLQDPWLARKLDRPRRLREHREYIDRYVPELKTLPPGLVIDIGPGGGELLELAREMGHGILGVDSPDGKGGMGWKYVATSRAICVQHQIPVHYCGLWSFLEGIESQSLSTAPVVLANFRGSIEQVFSDYMLGLPHHVTQRAEWLSWKIDGETAAAIVRMFRVFRDLMRDDGCVLIAGNGSANQVEAEQMILGAAEAAGLTLVERFDERTWKWRK